MDMKEKLVELPIEDAIKILREELTQKTDGYTTHLAYGGKGDPAEEVYLDALSMAIEALANGVTAQEDCKACAEATQNCIVKLQEQIAELRSVQEWISASDPPKDDLPVLVTCGKGYRPFVARYDLIWKRWRVSHTLKITHWQPLPSTRDLPQPPKGE